MIDETKPASYRVANEKLRVLPWWRTPANWKPHFANGTHEVAPYLWCGWWLVTWDRGRFLRTVRVSLMPD